MPAKLKIVKPSKYDVQAPAHVEVVYAIMVARAGNSFHRVPPVTFFEDTDPKVVQAKSDEMVKRWEPHTITTYWRERATKKRLSKTVTLKQGTSRRFLVTVPWKEGVSQERMKELLLEAVEELVACDELRGLSDIRVRALSENEVIGDNAINYVEEPNATPADNAS